MSIQAADNTQALEELLELFARRDPMSWKAVQRNRARNRALFDSLGGRLTRWAADMLGSNWASVLCDGYRFFNSHVARHQSKYETAGRYRHSSFAEVYASTYSQSSFMNDYHWGIYTASFFWEHHLRLYEFFRAHFVQRLSNATGRLIDLGAGSGMWSLLILADLPNWTVTGVDISRTSVDLANRLAATMGLRDRARYLVDDALKFTNPEPSTAGLSCFVAEHLEEPQLLFENVTANLEDRGLAFMLLALTAAEVDHIYEFRRESEPIQMAERAGLRVVATYSSAPADYPGESRYLPRSMALVLQKRRNDIW